jgi:cbb3-type cytochrome oxidase maturation protein
MFVVALLIVISLTLALAFLAGFIWAVKAGQFDDTFTPSLRILTEDVQPPNQPEPSQAKPN